MGNPAQLLEGCIVVLVEDDSDTRHMMKFVLEQNGATVTAAESVLVALDRIRFRSPDVIVADIAMPGLNGYALMAEVRKLDAERNVHTPAVAVTAFSTPQDKNRALAAGFEKYVSKPFDPQELVEAVQGLRSARA